MLKDTDTRHLYNTEHSSCSREIYYHGKYLVTDGGRNGEYCMMSMQLTDRIVTKIKNGYYENVLFSFMDLFRNKLEKDEIQTRC